MARLLAFDATTVLAARVQGRIVGTLTLVTLPRLPDLVHESKTSWWTRPRVDRELRRR